MILFSSICGALRDLVPFVHLKNVKNSHRGELILVVELQASACNFTKIGAPPWVFFTFFVQMVANCATDHI